LPGAGRLRLDFLDTYAYGTLCSRYLDFGVMAYGETVKECKEKVLEAILT
jgi:hypothetical protein